MSRVGESDDTLTPGSMKKPTWSEVFFFFKKESRSPLLSPAIRFTRTVKSVVFTLHSRDARSFHQTRWGSEEKTGPTAAAELAGSHLGVCGSILCVGD